MYSWKLCPPVYRKCVFCTKQLFIFFNLCAHFSKLLCYYNRRNPPIHYIVFATPHKKRNTFSLKRPVPRRVFLLTFLPSKLSPKKILNFFKKMFDKPIPLCYYIRVSGEQSRQNRIRPDGQAVKTTPSHGVNPGSIPGQVTEKRFEIRVSFLFSSFLTFHQIM